MKKLLDVKYTPYKTTKTHMGSSSRCGGGGPGGTCGGGCACGNGIRNTGKR